MHLFFVHLVLKVNCALTLVKTAQSVQASMLAHRVGVPKELEVTLLSNVKQILSDVASGHVNPFRMNCGSIQQLSNAEFF